MKVKTADLIGPALDWAVAKSLGLSVVTVTVEDQAAEHELVLRDHYSDTEWQDYLIEWNKYVRPTLRTRLAVLDSDGFPNGNPFMQNGLGVPLAFSVDWAQGGPIMEREGISPRRLTDGTWRADFSQAVLKADGKAYAYLQRAGPTPLIAAMRCFVASKLGEEVDIPEELLK